MSQAPTAQRNLLFEASGVRVFDFRCRARVEGEGPEEPNPTHTIALLRRGAFERTHRGERVIADVNSVLFFNRNEAYRYAHPFPGGDDCTILTVETTEALELVARHAPKDAESPEAPFRIGQAVWSRRGAWLHWELLARIGRPPRLAVEDVLAELADEAVAAAHRAREGQTGTDTASARTRRRRRELVEETKRQLNLCLESPPSLGELARRLGCSPFHLSRTFHRLAGVSLRRYLARLRAGAAADALARGAPDLTTLALELGYADHSHFTNAFREEWGLPPSRFRALLAPRKKLQAARPPSA